MASGSPSRPADVPPAAPTPGISTIRWLRGRPVLAGALVATLGLLLAHAWVYRFLTDDAFISFRYARNFNHGHGLVFNPGMERVEGYTNLLWVLVLAALDRAGVAPATGSLVLSVAATILLWMLVVRETLRRPPEPPAEWLVVLPALALAATRSVAVWTTGGLETRAFELLVMLGAMRLLREIEGELEGRPRRPIAALWMGLAVWTRPDGLLMAGAAFGVAALWLARHGRFAFPRFAVRTAPLAGLIAAQLAFRRLYYHAWLPNTYFAKVGGRTWWNAGLEYLGCFALEYALWLWLPLALIGARRLIREGRGLEPLVIAALILPHALYVAAIGGDHFEYRPLDAYFPLLFLLLYHGARHLARSHPSRAIVAAWLAATLLGLWELPWRSHQESPRRYVAGFPGRLADQPVGARFLSPGRDPIYRLPGLRAVADAHRRLLGAVTSHFVGIRQEEHRHFLELELDDARRLQRLMEAGRLPRDTYFAMPCVGVIPYQTGAPTLDRMGLTDAHVAHAPFIRRQFMAHDKTATEAYARERGVDLWTEYRPICDVTSELLRMSMRQTVSGEAIWYAADLGEGQYLLAGLPLGPERIARRMPGLSFVRLDQPAFVEPYVERCIPALEETLRVRPDDDDALRSLAALRIFRRQIAPARELYRRLTELRPDDAQAWLRLWWCCDRLGARAEGLAALERALAAAGASRDTLLVKNIREKLDVVRRAPPATSPPPPPG